MRPTKKERPNSRTMPAAGTRLAYRTVISACPVAMPDPIVFDELGKATSGAVLLPPLALGLAGLALHLSRRRFGGPLLAAFYGCCFRAPHVERHVSLNDGSWHFSDLPTPLTNVGYQGKSGSNSDIAKSTRLTYLGHPRDAALPYLLKHPAARKRQGVGPKCARGMLTGVYFPSLVYDREHPVSSSRAEGPASRSESGVRRNLAASPARRYRL